MSVTHRDGTDEDEETFRRRRAERPGRSADLRRGDLQDAGDALDCRDDRAAEEPERENDGGRDHGQDDDVLGHRLGFFAATAGANAVGPASGRHIPQIGGSQVLPHASSW